MQLQFVVLATPAMMTDLDEFTGVVDTFNYTPPALRKSVLEFIEKVAKED